MAARMAFVPSHTPASALSDIREAIAGKVNYNTLSVLSFPSFNSLFSSPFQLVIKARGEKIACKSAIAPASVVTPCPGSVLSAWRAGQGRVATLNVASPSTVEIVNSSATPPVQDKSVTQSLENV